jgi:hypothetical protein
MTRTTLGSGRTSAGSVPRRLGVGAVAVVLAAGVVPALAAAPAHAAIVLLTPDQAKARVLGIAADARAVTSTVGSSSVAELSIGTGTPQQIDATTAVTTDVLRRAVRTDSRMSIDLGALLAGFSDGFLHPCNPDGSGYVGSLLKGVDDSTIDQEGQGTFTYFGDRPGKLVRQGRKLVKRPGARWELKRNAALGFAAVVDRNDTVTSAAEFLNEPTTVITSASESTVTGGVRVDVAYQGEDGATGTLAAVVPSGAPVSELTFEETTAAQGEEPATQNTVVVRNSYGPQAVIAPKGAAVVERSKIRRGCTAALTSVLTKEIARKSAREVRSRGGTVTEGKVRRIVERKIRNTPARVRISDDTITGGVRITGRHPLLKKPVIRRVIVVNGKAVVRKGR